VWYLVGGGVTVLAGLVAFSVPAIMEIEHKGQGRSAPPADPGVTDVGAPASTARIQT
jgi:hypothetical protein